jgi:hypothetical protein
LRELSDWPALTTVDLATHSFRECARVFFSKPVVLKQFLVAIMIDIEKTPKGTNSIPEASTPLS